LRDKIYISEKISKRASFVYLEAYSSFIHTHQEIGGTATERGSIGKKALRKEEMAKIRVFIFMFLCLGVSRSD
jgi:hypothetical protein